LLKHSLPPILQVVGYKKSGKTTLICRLIEHYSATGLRIACIKHDAHTFEPDVPQTDSWKQRQSGAWMTALMSPERTAWFAEREYKLEQMLDQMREADVILIEGWKRANYPKLLLIQSADDIALIHELTQVLAVITWNESIREQLLNDINVPVLHFNDLKSILFTVETKLM
jgi:molybdopterin-guanine dinucleotide biosynthesis protein B